MNNSSQAKFLLNQNSFKDSPQNKSLTNKSYDQETSTKDPSTKNFSEIATTPRLFFQASSLDTSFSSKKSSENTKNLQDLLFPNKTPKSIFHKQSSGVLLKKIPSLNVSNEKSSKHKSMQKISTPRTARDLVIYKDTVRINSARPIDIKSNLNHISVQEISRKKKLNEIPINKKPAMHFGVSNPKAKQAQTPRGTRTKVQIFSQMTRHKSKNILEKIYNKLIGTDLIKQNANEQNKLQNDRVVTKPHKTETLKIDNPVNTHLTTHQKEELNLITINLEEKEKSDLGNVQITNTFMAPSSIPDDDLPPKPLVCQVNYEQQTKITPEDNDFKSSNKILPSLNLPLEDNLEISFSRKNSAPTLNLATIEDTSKTLSFTPRRKLVKVPELNLAAIEDKNLTSTPIKYVKFPENSLVLLTPKSQTPSNRQVRLLSEQPKSVLKKSHFEEKAPQKPDIPADTFSQRVETLNSRSTRRTINNYLDIFQTNKDNKDFNLNKNNQFLIRNDCLEIKDIIKSSRLAKTPKSKNKAKDDDPATPVVSYHWDQGGIVIQPKFMEKQGSMCFTELWGRNWKAEYLVKRKNQKRLARAVPSLDKISILRDVKEL